MELSVRDPEKGRGAPIHSLSRQKLEMLVSIGGCRLGKPTQQGREDHARSKWIGIQLVIRR